MQSIDILPHVQDLRAYARQLCRHADKAEDLLQETLARALSKIDLYDPSGSFRGWLCTIMKNLFLDAERRRIRWPSCSYAEQDHGGLVVTLPNQTDRLVMKELRAAFEALPDAHRAVLVAVVVDGLSYEQAADRLGVPVGTVRSRLFRARSTLMEQIDPPASEGGRALASGAPASQSSSPLPVRSGRPVQKLSRRAANLG
jgi:RNA polymerase sigma-70 factor (ECF subfamily)